MSRITRPEQERISSRSPDALELCTVRNEKVRSIFLTRHVLRLYYRIDGLETASADDEEEVDVKLYNFFALSCV